MTRLGDILHRFVLLAFPASFRRRHGRAMLEQFRAQRAAVAGRPIGIGLLWSRGLVDALQHGVACRLEMPRQTGGHPVGAWLPARRALRLSPTIALRAE